MQIAIANVHSVLNLLHAPRAYVSYNVPKYTVTSYYPEWPFEEAMS